jgi:hypothetical protein
VVDSDRYGSRLVTDSLNGDSLPSVCDVNDSFILFISAQKMNKKKKGKKNNVPVKKRIERQ